MLWFDLSGIVMKTVGGLWGAIKSITIALTLALASSINHQTIKNQPVTHLISFCQKELRAILQKHMVENAYTVVFSVNIKIHLWMIR